MAKGSLHEDVRHDDELIVGSDRKFGAVFVTVFAIVGLFPLLTRDPPEVRGWALVISGGFLAFTLIAPKLLHPLNVLWMKLALVMSKVVSPIVLGVLFFGTVLPMALILRAMKKDLLRLKLEPQSKSYWIERAPPGPEPETMRNQF
jgi:hypothetical protein